MTNLIDNTYFIGEISLPIDELGNQLTKIYIPKYQKKVLTDLLGYDLYKQFIDGLAEVTPEQKWLDLRDGKDYQIADIYYNWPGLVNTEKESLIAYYTYYKLLADKVAYATSSGIRVSLTENSEDGGTALKQVNAYREFLRLYNDCIHFIDFGGNEYSNFNPKVKEMINELGI